MQLLPDRKYLETQDVQLVAVVTQVLQGEVHEEHLFELSTNYEVTEHEVQLVDVVTHVKQLASHYKH